MKSEQTIDYVFLLRRLCVLCNALCAVSVGAATAGGALAGVEGRRLEETRCFFPEALTTLLTASTAALGMTSFAYLSPCSALGRSPTLEGITSNTEQKNL